MEEERNRIGLLQNNLSTVAGILKKSFWYRCLLDCEQHGTFPYILPTFKSYTRLLMIIRKPQLRHGMDTGYIRILQKVKVDSDMVPGSRSTGTGTRQLLKMLHAENMRLPQWQPVK